MKICLINNLYKPYARGGAEKVTAILANGLIKAGHEVAIVTTKPWLAGKSDQGDFKLYYFKSLYYNLNKLPKFLRFFWHLWDMFNLASYFRIKKILKKEKCQAVVTNNLMGLGFLTPLAIKRLKIRQIHLAHDIQLIHPAGLLRLGQENLIEKYWARNYAGLMSRLFASPRAVIFPSRWLMNLHLDKIFFIKSKRIVLPNPAPPLQPKADPRPPCFAKRNGQAPRADNLPLSKGENNVVPLLTKEGVGGGFIKEREGWRDGTFKFLYLGQIEKHKGLNLLIQAFKKVKERFPRTELIIAGSGSQLGQAKLEAGQGESIKFLGWQDEPEINRLLKISQILVVPTLCYENCPAAILEAFSAGLPVMAADLGGISELLSKNAGLLFKPADPEDLADKMTWAINHRDELAEMAEAGRAKAVLGSVEYYVKELEGLMKL